MDTELFNTRLRDFERRLVSFLEAGQDVDNTHLLAVRECGDCVACCIHPAISREQYRDLGMPRTEAKPYGKKCVHCTGKGCGVYEVRPAVCKGYQCLWKFGLTDLPPNVSGVAWSFEPEHQTMEGWVVVGHADDAEAALGSNDLLLAMSQFLTITLLSLPVCLVVVRDLKTCNKVTRRHGNRLLVKTCDLDANNEPDFSSLRSRICTVVQTGGEV